MRWSLLPVPLAGERILDDSTIAGTHVLGDCNFNYNCLKLFNGTPRPILNPWYESNDDKISEQLGSALKKLAVS